VSYDEEDRRPGPMPTLDVPRRRSPMLIATMVVSIVVVIGIVVANVWTEYAWYSQTGYSQVWSTQWIARLIMFLVFGLIAAGAVWGTLRWARSARPALSAARNTPLDQFREQVRPVERVVTVVLPLGVGFVSGVAMSGYWAQALVFFNQVRFGIADPEFGLDASFYVFTLPVLQALLGFIIAILVMCLLLAGFVHLLYGGISGGGRTFVASRGARVQLAILGALLMIAIAMNYWLERYALMTKQSERFSGAMYTDINAILPARGILFGIAILVAVLFLAVIWRGDWRIPGMGVALMVLAAIVVGGIYPAIVQRFQVTPNEQEYEAPYIQRTIDSTLYAYGLEDVEVTPYRAKTVADAAALRADADTTAQIRLLDPNIVAPTFQQLQQNKQYYTFKEQLNVDRYRLDGELQDTVIAVRELNMAGLSAENRTWVNDHTVYTHGFGVVAAYGNSVAADGRPQFFQSGIPSTGELGDYEPRVYFGTTLPDYSIVGAPEGTTPWELDYPDDASGGQVNTTYSGDGGPGVGNFFAKLMYAIKYGETQILFSSRVTEESQILYYRDPIERVARVAPYLELDSTTYPAVVDGRLVWIVDGYTTTRHFPYSAAISGSLFAGTDPLQPAVLNYVRNSVKATVDAYDGSITLYAWDAEDPILAAWEGVFPSTVKPMSEISGELMSHLRYPEELFAIQRFQLASYHVSDASEFYSGQDFWRNPMDPTAPSVVQPPYYLTLQMPGQDEPSFSLTSTYIPGGNTDRNVLTGFLAVDSETGDTPGKVSDSYGTFRLLELPRDTTVSGPGQVQNQFNADPEAQNVLNLLRQGETDVINGNLLTVPVGGGLLYVQPVYVRSSQGTQFPLLQKVFVSFGDEVGFADTLSQALDQVFGEGAAPDDPDNPDEPSEPVSPSDPDGGELGPELDAIAEARNDLRSALVTARQAIDDSRAALADGDFTAYGQAQEQLAAALEDAVAAQEALDEALAAAEAEAQTVAAPA
jgi:uncharacterized membrane protein (UPF0182 family)